MDILSTILGMFGGKNPAPKAGGAPAPGTSDPFMSLLSKTLFGRADEDLDQDELSRRNRRRSEAGDLAKSAMQNPGKSFMSPPSAGGRGFGLEDLTKVIGSLFSK